MVKFCHALDCAYCIVTIPGSANGNERTGWSKAAPNRATLVIIGCAGADVQSAVLRMGHTTSRLRFSIYSPHFRLGSLTSLPKPVFGATARGMQENTGRVAAKVWHMMCTPVGEQGNEKELWSRSYHKMRKGIHRMYRRLKSRKAQSLVEYSLILALIAVVAIMVLKGLGKKVNNTLSSVNANLP